MTDTQHITLLPTPTLPTIAVPDSYDSHRSEHTPLIIDNGSTNLRYGFATASSPHSGLNVVAKYKERKFNKPLLLFGDAVDLESGAKGQARTPWEGDVLLNFDALVCAISTSSSVRTDTTPFLNSRRRRTHLTMLSFA